jgi:hypothetical protein
MNIHKILEITKGKISKNSSLLLSFVKVLEVELDKVTKITLI